MKRHVDWATWDLFLVLGVTFLVSLVGISICGVPEP
jgi:hypothetical protein